MSTQIEDVEAEIVEEKIDSSLALNAVTRAEVDIQIATAKLYPRSISKAKQQAKELACLDQDTAASMYYSLPARRGSDKKIEGPSVRLAEVIRYAWGHIRSESYVSAIDDSFVTATGSCIDLEKNVAARVSVKRRITDRHGNRYSEDMIAVTSNAACSIAQREATFRVIPRALFKDVYDSARTTAIGGGKSMSEMRSDALSWFEKRGAKRDKIFAALGCRGIEDITLDDLSHLMGMKTAITDNELSIEEAFARPDDAKHPSEAASDLNAKLNAKREEMKQPNVTEGSAHLPRVSAENVTK